MNKKTMLAAAVVSVLSTGMIASGVAPIFAADTPSEGTGAPADEQAANETADKDFVKVSEDALMTMRNVRSARLAIFNGMPENAQTHVDAAVARVAATVRDAERFELDTKEPITDDRYVPFDASLTVMDNFVPSAANAKHIAKANEHLHKGEKKEALEVLKLGEIDVAVTASLVPLNLAKENIEEAAKLVDEGKYYEANLALKAVEDAVVVDTFAVDALPKAKAEAKAKATNTEAETEAKEKP
jgi:hypothetical protein